LRPLLHFLQSHLPALNAGTGRLRLHPLQGDGSDRRIFRLFVGRRSFIGVVHPQGGKGSPSENDSFYYICGHLRNKGLPAPEIYAFDRRRGLFLMEDFGDCHLATFIGRLKDLTRIKKVYQTVIRLLIRIQIRGAEDFDTRLCYDTPLFDGRFSWERETRYFLQAFCTGYLGLKEVPRTVEEELQDLALAIDQEKIRLFLYRDFQSRNLMIRPGGIGLIDFQAARLGPPQYDLASLLIDPYVNLSETLQEALLEGYLAAFSALVPVQEREFRKHYELIAFQRNLQILGAFAFLSRVKGKTSFEAFIPAALSSLKRRVAKPFFRKYRRARKWIEGL
jgi:aminoglycoside/choline kinase family phosphotransferase